MSWKSAHTCTLTNDEDVLFQLIPGTSRFAAVRRAFVQYFTISEDSRLAVQYFKSHRAIQRECDRHMRGHFYMIHPYSLLRQHWEFFMVPMYMFSFCCIPIYTFFVARSPTKHTHTFISMCDFILCLIFSIDIAINLFTGYVRNKNKKDIVLTPWKVALHYLPWMAIDVFTSVPLDHIACSLGVECRQNEFCRVVSNNMAIYRLFKCLRFKTFWTYYHRLLDRYQVKFVPSEIIFFCISGALLINLFGSVLYAMSMSFIGPIPTWVTRELIYKKPLFVKYLRCISSATLLLLNVDHGIPPSPSPIDKAITVVYSTIGSLLYVVMIGRYLQWTSIIWAVTQKYEDVQLQLQAFMCNKKLPRFLQERIKHYYEFRFQKSYFQESAILPLLSSSLREDIVMHSCRRMVQSVNFFHGIPAAMLVRIVVCLRPEIFLVNDVIMKAGTEGHSMYFITSGTVAVFSSSGKEICHLEDGTHFGEVALVMEEASRVASVVAVESCEMQRLDRAEYKRVVAPYPDLAMRIERIAEERLEMSVAFDEFHRRSFRAQKRV